MPSQIQIWCILPSAVAIESTRSVAYLFLSEPEPVSKRLEFGSCKNLLREIGTRGCRHTPDVAYFLAQEQYFSNASGLYSAGHSTRLSIAHTPHYTSHRSQGPSFANQLALISDTCGIIDGVCEHSRELRSSESTLWQHSTTFVLDLTRGRCLPETLNTCYR